MGELSEQDERLLHAVQGGKSCKKCDIRALISSGADPTVVDPTSGLRPIHIAARAGNLNVLKALLEDDRVHADCVDARGKVPYEWAEEFKHAKAETFLLNTIIENPDSYSSQSIREARHHLAIKGEVAPA